MPRKGLRFVDVHFERLRRSIHCFSKVTRLMWERYLDVALVKDPFQNLVMGAPDDKLSTRFGFDAHSHDHRTVAEGFYATAIMCGAISSYFVGLTTEERSAR